MAFGIKKYLFEHFINFRFKFCVLNNNWFAFQCDKVIKYVIR